MKDIEFKIFSPAETREALEELKQLAVQSYGTYENVLGPEGTQAMRNNFTNDKFWDLVFSNSTCFVAKSNGKIVGMAFLISSGNPWKFFEAEWSYIRMVGVLPEFERCGIGKKLTQMCIDFAKQSGEKTVALHTSEIMPAARHIYEKFGFRILKEIEPQWGKCYWIYTLNINELD